MSYVTTFGKGERIFASIMKFVDQSILTLNLVVLGCDDAANNTGQKTGTLETFSKNIFWYSSAFISQRAATSKFDWIHIWQNYDFLKNEQISTSKMWRISSENLLFILKIWTSTSLRFHWARIKNICKISADILEECLIGINWQKP